MVCYTGPSDRLTQFVLWTAYLSALARLSPSLVPLEPSSSLSPVTVSGLGSKECEQPLIDILEMRCGHNITIFTDTEPGDLWAIAAIFKQAKELQCTDEYPIKAIFGGGGSNAGISLAMLKRFLVELQQRNLVPRDQFNVDEAVFAGPTSPLENSPDWRHRFSGHNPRTDIAQFERPDVVSWANQDSVSTAMNSLNDVKRTLDRYNQPMIVALRPLFEFFIPWYNNLLCSPSTSTQCNFIPPSRRYQRKIEENGWGNSFFAEALTNLKTCEVVTFLNPDPRAQIAAFYRLYTQGNGVATNEDMVIGAFELFVVLAPRVYAAADYSDLTQSEDGRACENTDLFTASVLTNVWHPMPHERVSNRPYVARMLQEFTTACNEVKMQELAPRFISLLISGGSKAAKSALDRFYRLRRVSLRLAEQEMVQPFTRVNARKESWHSGIQKIREVLNGLNVPHEQHQEAATALKQWAWIAPSRHSFVELSDVLVPLLIHHELLSVKAALLPVQVSLDNDGRLKWTRVGEGQASGNIWRTWKGNVKETIGSDHDNSSASMCRYEALEWNLLEAYENIIVDPRG